MEYSTHNVRRANWLNIVNQCQERPLDVLARQWLADNSIKEKAYYYWLCKFRKEAYGRVQVSVLRINRSDQGMPEPSDGHEHRRLVRLSWHHKSELFLSVLPCKGSLPRNYSERNVCTADVSYTAWAIQQEQKGSNTQSGLFLYMFNIVIDFSIIINNMMNYFILNIYKFIFELVFSINPLTVYNRTIANPFS